jgi:hypothetical protein
MKGGGYEYVEEEMGWERRAGGERRGREVNGCNM